MFLRVKDNIQLEQFNQLWIETWSSKGHEIDPYQGLAHRFIIFSEENTPAATVEIVPYDPDLNDLRATSTVEQLFKFSDNEIVQLNKGFCYELDKLSISHNYMGTGVLDKVLGLLVQFAEKNNVKYYLSLTEPLLFRALKLYKFPIFKVGDTIEDEKGSKFIPSISDVQHLLKNKGSYESLMYPEEIEDFYAIISSV